MNAACSRAGLTSSAVNAPVVSSTSVESLCGPPTVGRFVSTGNTASPFGTVTCDTGEGVPQDDAEAVIWYRRAAEQGHAGAQYSLGRMYDIGRGAPEDDAEAVRWFRLAAEQGEASAQYNLGVMYGTGEGVPQDDAEAVRWYRLAAEQGTPRAPSESGTAPAKACQNNLGVQQCTAPVGAGRGVRVAR